MLANYYKQYYYNTPEGNEPFLKIGRACLYGFYASVMVGAMDTIAWSRAANFAEGVNCMAYYVIPITATAATFAAATYSVTKIRGKDDNFNGLIGVCASGTIVQFWRKSLRLTYSYAFFGCVGYLLFRNGAITFSMTKSPRMVSNFYKSWYENRPKQWEM